MEAIMQNRFEGSIFFVYDRHFLQREEDRLEDAIIYFYPHSMPLDNQCRLCGQLMGVAQFAETIFDSYPVLFRFGNEKIAVKHVGKYSFALAGSSVEPDSALLETVDHLYCLFSFYHGSIHQVELECDNDKEKFLPEIRMIWEQYLAFIRNYGDNLPSVFNPIPYLPLKYDPNFYFLKASHILESCQRRPQIIAGSILYNRYILCSQLTDSISRCLLLLKPNQQNHPAVPIETDYQLPFGVRLFNVYLNRNELKEILENNDNSPYHSQSETLSSLHGCCTGHRTPRRTPRATPCRMFLEQEPLLVNTEEVLTQSEKDPLSSSDNSRPKLCKAMLEELILNGFKCCKCVDDSEAEEASFDTSVESVIEVMEKMKPKNGFLYSTENIERNDIPENEDRDTISKNSVRSQNSVRTVETESGIEVTGSDFHSSAATHFDQRSGSLRDRSYLGKCRNYGGEFEHGKTGQCSSNEVSKDTERFFEGNRNFGSETARNEEKSECNEVDEEKVEQKYGDCTLNENVGVTLFDQARTQPSEKSCHQTTDEIYQVKKHTRELSKKSDHVFDSANVVGKDAQHLGEDDDVSDVNEVPDVEKDSKKVRGISYNEHLDVTSSVEDDEQLYQSSEDSYRTPDEILDTDHCGGGDGLNWIHDSIDELSEINGDQEGIDAVLDETVIHVCKLRKKENAERGGLGSTEEGNSDVACSKDGFEIGKPSNRHKNCCEVDGLLHANLFVQAHSEIVLILLAKCDLYQNEEVVRSLWNTSLSQLGELDILMKNCAKDDHQDSQGMPFNLLIYDNFEKTMSGNLREPVYSQDHVFCETAKTLHNHFNNAPQLCDVTLRNFRSGIYGERTLSREAYYQEGANITSSSDRHMTPSISGYLAQRMRECIVRDHGLPFV